MVKEPGTVIGLFSQLSGLRKLPAVTSWTPDWSISQPRPPIAPRVLIRESACDVKLAKYDRHLLVKGVVTDTVMSRAELSFVDTNSTGEGELNEEPQEQPWKFCLETFPRISPLLYKLWNVRVWNNLIGFALLGESPELNENFDALAEAVNCSRSVPSDADIAWILVKIISVDPLPIDIDEEEQPRDLQDALQEVKNSGASIGCLWLFELEE
jgi:hypothetical protein